MTIRLRGAGFVDEALLLTWANDPQVRAMARRQAAISPAEHSAWFAGKLADAACRIWIAEEGGRPVGQIRLDRAGDSAEVDISVDAGARGKGIGVTMLRAPELVDWPGLREIRAVVRRENAASRAVFRAAGFEQTGEDGAYVYLTMMTDNAKAR